VEEMFELIGTINREGLSVLLMEQNVVQSLAIATRAYIIELGVVALSGEASGLAENPELKKRYLGL
jgi:branched-chain amino acid transport system ATP-binding protein